ncbi:MAG: Spy/CpxP family protein refolding chaperone [Gemmatimonadota bacterium]|nr:Spy/CpxP family protein refolding chaperone [Gemmatimonadota bacterium]MDE2866735.1 Spy/CpxP family protein refolding chaperone [Gemmatimonadota bacterium]
MNTGISRINLLAAAALAILFAAAIAPSGLDAQRQGSRARAAAGAAPVERAIRLADELELTPDQRTQLEGMRAELLEQRTARATALMALRSEIAAGIREPEAMRQALTEQWRGGADARESLRDRLSEILTEDQREELQRMNRRAIARQRGPANRGRIDRQRGPRGTRPFDRGRRPSRSRGDRR